MSDSEDLVAHMRPVQSAERDLRDLGLIWQMIESSAAISCPDEVAPILPTLIDTRRRFDELQARLIRQMVLENRAELGDDLSAKAQCAIDILVRNLYERTADVGFLATDDSVRAFCAAPAAQREAERPAMQRRLAEYQAKYTVYDDVLLLSPQGELLARLDGGAGLAPGDASRDRLVADALAARGYVERFGTSDLASGGGQALLYAHRIQAPDGRPAGVLVLRFRFADEMRRIFDDIVDDPQRVVLMLVDEQRIAIATSDEAHVPTGSRLPALPDGEAALTSFAGREYMAIHCASGGYQGYAGPRWRTVAMVSLLTAFRQRHGDEAADVPLDNPELGAVQAEADAINRELRRVLWNGRVMTGDDDADRVRLKAVLRQVSLTGGRTRARVNRAIHDIYRVALARARHQARELARLAADIMDRNLYERANDCRWWALSPLLQRTLAEPPSAEGAKKLQAMLAHVNGLYTVYSQLVAFDQGGAIRAVSVTDEAERRVGHAVPAHWLAMLQSLSNSQRYAVTPFEPTDLHPHGATYVYLAAVRDPAGTRPVGGIAIVFHAARELTAMLHDIVGERPGFAAFVDASGRVLAASDPALAVGEAIGFAGDGAVVEHQQAHYACARVRATGYREFKTSDGYDNGVSAVVGLRLGPSERRRASFSDHELAALPSPAGAARAKAIEVAVFQVGATRYALPAIAIVEAMPPQAVVRTPSVGGATLGMLEAGGDAGLLRVLCARRLFDVGYPARGTDGVVLVLRAPNGTRPVLGLRVDDVLTVLEVPMASVHDAPRGVQSFAAWVTALIDCESESEAGRERALLQLLSHERLLADLAPESLRR